MMLPIDRRLFLSGSAASLGYFFTADAFSAARAADKPGEKIRMAAIGIGGKGDGDSSQAGKLGEMVAICDIEDSRLDKKGKEFPQAKQYFDFRKMLDEMGKNIDAVVVSTPDHTHAPAAVMAMRMKKHVYVQKPMTHSVFEARVMRETAKKYGVCTQMGNQGSAENGLRRGVEIIQAGLIGPVKEAHVWTNRPIWPQAPKVMARPKGEFAVPKGVHWDEFIGPAPMRAYAPGYHPFAWRGWWDFGTGAIGDMACHTANLAFRALKLGYPTSVVAEAGDVNTETCPSWAHVVIDFPSRGDLPPVKFNWYEGQREGKKVTPPEELLAKVLKKDEKLAGSGSILVGEKGILFSPNDYGAKFVLVGEGLSEIDTTKPEKLPMNGKGDAGMKEEWVAAIREGKPEIAYSNFEIAGMLTEAILLGNVAIRAGKKLEWDGPNLRCSNNKDADQFIKREYRKGWEVSAEA
ncbi:MAG: Gfo/Idh/MocA family oxidoreductase [Planctomycetes bacterium]|nr:Gfo/Idh/MocA family oxidoreductase [Planctomycetota bacterium]